MKYIFPYILSNHLIDRYDIWVNTTNMTDIRCFRSIAETFTKVRLIYQPDGIVDGIKSINAFYKNCMDPDTIYIKIDDDIIWMQPDIFEKIISFRITHPEAFLVSPMVINNTLCSYIWQTKGILNYGKYMSRGVIHKTFWKLGFAALQLHNFFLDKMENDDHYYTLLHTGSVPQGCGRFSINFILWFGNDMALFNGEIPGDDEEFLSSVIAPKLGKQNYIDGECIVAHFAFGSQRQILDKSNILERYGHLCRHYFQSDETLDSIYHLVEKHMDAAEKPYLEETTNRCPYPIIRKSIGQRIKQAFKKQQKLITYHYEKWKGVKYVVQEGDIFTQIHP